MLQPGGARDELYRRLEELLQSEDLLGFLRQRVRGDLKFHHEFRISLADCPNACSQPQIKDVGILGAVDVRLTGEPCTAAGPAWTVLAGEGCLRNLGRAKGAGRGFGPGRPLGGWALGAQVGVKRGLAPRGNTWAGGPGTGLPGWLGWGRARLGAGTNAGPWAHTGNLAGGNFNKGPEPRVLGRIPGGAKLGLGGSLKGAPTRAGSNGGENGCFRPGTIGYGSRNRGFFPGRNFGEPRKALYGRPALGKGPLTNGYFPGEGIPGSPLPGSGQHGAGQGDTNGIHPVGNLGLENHLETGPKGTRVGQSRKP